MFRRAFQWTHKKKSRKFICIIAVAVLLLATAGGVIHHQKHKLDTLWARAEIIFSAAVIWENPWLLSFDFDAPGVN